VDTSIVPCTKSDHDALVVTFSLPSTFSTPFFWRYNTSLLSSDDLIESTASSIAPFHTNLSWDATKVIAASLARDFAVVDARRRRSHASSLERRLAHAQHKAAQDPLNAMASATVADLRGELDSLVTQAASRAILRARVRWLEEGETCSSYFFSRFRSRSQTSTLTNLRDTHGAPFITDTDRHDYIRSYFTRMCSAPLFSQHDITSFLSPLSLPQLSPSHLSLLTSPFTADELFVAIRALRPRRAPGPDGIPYEWYQTFADTLVPVLLPLFNSILAGAPPPPSWSRTVISLLPKPDRDLSSLANWRPITLSNCDCKIFSRLLTSRLALVLPDLVARNQAGFVKGRQAADIAMAMRTVLGYAAEHPVDGGLILLDQEKAYDRISHPYLFSVLSSFGFPPLLQHALRCYIH
jgi:hypothetical protein